MWRCSQATSIIKKCELWYYEDFENTDEVVVIGLEDHEINVSHIVYETILGLPIRKFHDQETNGQICDEEVLKDLENIKKRSK